MSEHLLTPAQFATNLSKYLNDAQVVERLVGVIDQRDELIDKYEDILAKHFDCPKWQVMHQVTMGPEWCKGLSKEQF